MDIDVNFQGRSLPIKVADPYRMDTRDVVHRITTFLDGETAADDGLALEQLLPQMVRGVAGCEGGCPADARWLVRRGFGDYQLNYIDGGILTAKRELTPDSFLEIKIFPEF